MILTLGLIPYFFTNILSGYEYTLCIKKDIILGKMCYIFIWLRIICYLQILMRYNLVSYLLYLISFQIFFLSGYVFKLHVCTLYILSGKM